METQWLFGVFTANEQKQINLPGLKILNKGFIAPFNKRKCAREIPDSGGIAGCFTYASTIPYLHHKIVVSIAAINHHPI